MTHAQLLLRVLLARGCNPRAGSAILAARISLARAARELAEAEDES